MKDIAALKSSELYEAAKLLQQQDMLEVYRTFQYSDNEHSKVGNNQDNRLLLEQVEPTLYKVLLQTEKRRKLRLKELGAIYRLENIRKDVPVSKMDEKELRRK